MWYDKKTVVKLAKLRTTNKTHIAITLTALFSKSLVVTPYVIDSEKYAISN